MLQLGLGLSRGKRREGVAQADLWKGASGISGAHLVPTVDS